MKMNQSEDLEMKLQKVKLAIEEVKELRSESDIIKQMKIDKLLKIKEEIKIKGRELKIELEAA